MADHGVATTALAATLGLAARDLGHRGLDFNDDFDVSLTQEQERAGVYEYNFRQSPVWSPPQDLSGPFAVRHYGRSPQR